MAGFVSCHGTATQERKRQRRGSQRLIIALAGNANVGKSVIFNQLTGASQIIGNWPGKTVERAEGKLSFEGYEITIVDLPGIYSLSPFSLEELITREYIASEKPDVVINIIDASVLERNLFFTLQLKEMEIPLVICLNQMDVAAKKGISVDVTKLEAILGIPVVPTIAVRGEGLWELTARAIEVARHGYRYRWRHRRGQQSVPPRSALTPTSFEYGAEVEARIKKLTQLLESEPRQLEYSPRWVAIKLLEDDIDIKKEVTQKSEEVVHLAQSLAKEMEHIHKEPSFAVIAAERYARAHRTASEVYRRGTAETTFLEKLDAITTHKVTGYITSAVVIVGLLLWTFLVGNFLSTLLSSAFSFFQPVDPKVSGPALSVLWNGAFGGFVAGVTLVIPYVVPFYLMLAMMEDSGILTRVAFMMDSAMHQMGLHGKAIIPLILGYGCNVPAIYTTRILETKRERLLAGFAITFAPCAARTIVILGLVAAFVGIQWALALYVVDLLIIFALAKVALKVVPGKLTGLIMEMHSFRMPSLSVVTKQTWARTKSIIYMVFPIYMIGTALVQGLYILGALDYINKGLSFLTVEWLGLPAIAGILLIFGAVRKELIFLTLVAIYGVNLAAVLTPAQFIVLAFVGMIYLPCIATIGILAQEFGRKAAITISAANLASAILLGGIAYRFLALIL